MTGTGTWKINSCHYSVFSLLFEVADKSLKVADSAIHDTCSVGDRGVLQKSGGSRGQGRGGRTPDIERLNEMQSI